MKRLVGRRAIVTGGGDGLGRAIAHDLAVEGAELIVFDLDSDAAHATAADISQIAGSASVVVGSVASPADVESLFAHVDRCGGVDILVNNAGVSSNGNTCTLTHAEWDRVVAVNLTGAFLCAQEAGRRMVAARRGSIVNVASMYGVTPAPERLAYCVTKSGVAMMARALAAEWGPIGVRVNAVAPGYVKTPLIDALVERGVIDLEALARRAPLGRLGSREEIARLVTFLASDDSSYITGQIIGADGGWTAYGYL